MTNSQQLFFSVPRIESAPFAGGPDSSAIGATRGLTGIGAGYLIGYVAGMLGLGTTATSFLGGIGGGLFAGIGGAQAALKGLQAYNAAAQSVFQSSLTQATWG